MEISWKNTLYYQNKCYGHIDKMQEMAKITEYPFFCWNGLIFRTSDCSRTPYTIYDL